MFNFLNRTVCNNKVRKMFYFKNIKLFYRCAVLRKQFSNVSCNIMTSERFSMQCKEFTVPFPSGYIAAKAWGNESGIPVLALHGWQDNIGTFDRLIPMLSSELYVVGFDNLGHGLSSHKPPGTFYNYMEMLFEIKRVVDYLKWERFSILAHSLGATVALIYGSLYPECVSNIICLDIIKPTSRDPKHLPVSTKFALDAMLRLEEKLSDTVPVYSVNEAKKRLMDGIVEPVTSEAADTLMKRGTKPSESGNGVVFTRDIRVQMIEALQKLSHDDLKAYLCNLECNLMIIIGSESKIYMSRNPEVIDDFISLYKQSCKSFSILKVEGNHFVHINNPENVAPHINDFFSKYGKQMSNL